jgi:hypothetical protein
MEEFFKKFSTSVFLEHLNAFSKFLTFFIIVIQQEFLKEL